MNSRRWLVILQEIAISSGLIQICFAAAAAIGSLGRAARPAPAAIRPRSSEDSGFIYTAAAKTASVPRSWLLSSRAGKKFLLMTSARPPKIAKSYLGIFGLSGCVVRVWGEINMDVGTHMRLQVRTPLKDISDGNSGHLFDKAGLKSPMCRHDRLKTCPRSGHSEIMCGGISVEWN